MAALGNFGRALGIGAVCMAALLAAACGGDGDDPFTGPRLAGTPLPTATPQPTVVPVCDIENPVEPPVNFPTDVPYPPGYVLSAVETDPHLRTEGRVKVPDDAYVPEDSGFLPTTALEVAIVDILRLDWNMTTNEVEGRDYNFEHPDGRIGHFNSQLILECPLHATLTYDFYWITPDASAPEAATPTP